MCVLVNDVVYFIVFSISKNLPDPYIIYTIFNIQFLIFHLCSTSNILDTGQSKRKTFSLLFSKFISSAITRGKINNPLPPQYDRMVSRENSRYPTNPSTGKEILPSKFLHQLNESVIRGACSTKSKPVEDFDPPSNLLSRGAVLRCSTFHSLLEAWNRVLKSSPSATSPALDRAAV